MSAENAQLTPISPAPNQILLLASPLHLVVLVVLLADRQPLAGQRLLVALLDLDVAALQLERTCQRTAGPHPRKVLGRVHGEDVTHDLGQDGRRSSYMQVHRVDAHQHKAQAVPAVGAAREVWKAEEATFDILFVLGNRGRCDQLAHEPACCASIRLDQCRLLVGTFGIPKGAMHHVERVPQLFLLSGACLGIRDQQLDDRWGVDDPAVTLSKPTGSCCYGLLAHPQFVAEIPAFCQPCLSNSVGHEGCLQLFVVHGLWYGAR
jgi:hypothetical protein